MRGSVIDRQRFNQPQGYLLGEHHNAAPVTHFCLRHNYLYYPESWTDVATGQAYRAGYYDESGQYYENVAFYEDGKYKNVICQCEYCDTVTKIDWTEGGPLICAQCGGTMKILSALDEYTQDPNYDHARRMPGYVDYADRNAAPARAAVPSGTSGSSRSRSLFRISLVLIAVAAAVGLIYGIACRKARPSVDPSALSNPELFGYTFYVNQVSPGVYCYADCGSGDKRLVWDSGEESYRDSDSGLWLWYNTDVEPPLWQYWYEPISGDYGDYGWMEYEDGSWYIEVERGRWMPVPDSYDLSPLWHIDPEASPSGPGERLPSPYDDDSGEDWKGRTEPESAETPDDLIVPGSDLYAESCRTEGSDAAFALTYNEDAADKLLRWDDGEQSWHDEETELWLWYNTDVEPALWQYWYEPISGDYGAYGWMEYENGTWFIEIDAGEWIEVPEAYDLSPLWHLEP